jgi:hypothetical protein
VLLCTLVATPLYVAWGLTRTLVRATVVLQVVLGAALLAGAVAGLPLAVAAVPLVMLGTYTHLGEQYTPGCVMSHSYNEGKAGGCCGVVCIAGAWTVDKAQGSDAVCVWSKGMAYHALQPLPHAALLPVPHGRPCCPLAPPLTRPPLLTLVDFPTSPCLLTLAFSPLRLPSAPPTHPFPGTELWLAAAVLVLVQPTMRRSALGALTLPAATCLSAGLLALGGGGTATTAAQGRSQPQRQQNQLQQQRGQVQEQQEGPLRRVLGVGSSAASWLGVPPLVPEGLGAAEWAVWATEWGVVLGRDVVCR